MGRNGQVIEQRAAVCDLGIYGDRPRDVKSIIKKVSSLLAQQQQHRNAANVASHR